MYEKMKAELERKTGASSLPDIYLIDMSSPSNVVERQKAFTSRQQFNEFVNGLEKENNNVRARARKNASDHSSKLRQMLTNQKEANFVAFDLEVYDKDRQTILEVGSVKFTLKDDDKPEYFHAIIEENLHLVNSNVGDNRDNFKFGTSQRMSLKEAAALLQEKIASADVLVVHAGANDDKYLADNDIKTAEKTTFDTQILALNLLPTSNPRMISWGLKKILEELLISFDQDILHNAGNDAHYTTMAFKRLVKKAMPGARF
ncbi:hypothetical protein QZH41_002337 [Actinostola sp. cb2023]|nr:hypothetical protein QZH41_002337 [Actinostola sp. cb2023]